MRKITSLLSLPIVILVGAFCSCHRGNRVEEMPEFPSEYKTYMERDSISVFPVIGKDNGFCPISGNIEYYSLPEDLKGNSFADSLKTLYNTTLAFNSLAYDISTYERQGEYYGYKEELLGAFKNMPLDGIGDASIKRALRNMLNGACEQIAKSEPVNGSDKGSAKSFYDAFNSFLDKLLARYEPEHAQLDSYLPDYSQLHQKATCDTTSYRDEILSKYLKEKDVNKKCVYAHEFAISNHKHPEQNDTLLIALIDPLLRGNEYSPLMNDLWKIWRMTMQLNLLSGPSNDSGMYNLFYNSMRTRVADKYIRHLAQHPDDAIAFNELLSLAYEYNIVRNGPFPLGNNAIMDWFEIYEPESLEKDENEK